LFGGIGACSSALTRLGIDYEIADYVEIDKYAVASYNAIHGTSFEPQDICEWNKDIDVDLIMHGSPCQDFSVAGKGAGGDEGSGTRSSLMYETIRIVEKLKPKYVIWENVKNLLSKKHIHNFKNYINTMEQLGYNSYYQVLNAKDYGIPQNRERVFTISIRQDIDNGAFHFPKPFELKLKLKDMLEENVDEKYYLSDKMINYISQSGTKDFKLNDSRINLDIARPLTTDQNKRAGTTNYLSDKLPNNYDLKIKNNTKKGYLVAKERRWN
jgi:DNA (cytosine-5)-methyltransferase 1